MHHGRFHPHRFTVFISEEPTVTNVANVTSREILTFSNPHEYILTYQSVGLPFCADPTIHNAQPCTFRLSLLIREFLPVTDQLDPVGCGCVGRIRSISDAQHSQSRLQLSQSHYVVPARLDSVMVCQYNNSESSNSSLRFNVTCSSSRK